MTQNPAIHGQETRQNYEIFNHPMVTIQLPLVLFIVIMFLIGHGKMGFMPDFARLENPQSNLASELITEDGELLGKYFIENRSFRGL